MNSKKTILVLFLATVFLSLAACEREGPAERAGEQIDNAVEDAGAAIENAGDKVRDATN
jgi:predicted small lipoprotein YifL